MDRAKSKYFNTAKLMDEALLLLLSKKGYDFISIKEVCQKAGVNRSTFYLHYENMSDLLKECLEYVNEDFVNQFNGNHPDLSGPSLKGLFLVKDEYLIPYLTFVKDNKTFFQAIVQQPALLEANQRFDGLSKGIISPILDRYNVPSEDHEYLVEFYIKGITAIILKWVEKDCVGDIQHIADLIKNCTPHPKI